MFWGLLMVDRTGDKEASDLRGARCARTPTLPCLPQPLSSFSPEVRAAPESRLTGTEVLKHRGLQAPRPAHRPSDLLPPVLSSATGRRHANQRVRIDTGGLPPRLDGTHPSSARRQLAAHRRCLRGRARVPSPPAASPFPSLLQGRCPRRPPRSAPGLTPPAQRSPCQTSLPERPLPRRPVHSSFFIFLLNIPPDVTLYRWLQ